MLSGGVKLSHTLLHCLLKDQIYLGEVNCFSKYCAAVVCEAASGLRPRDGDCPAGVRVRKASLEKGGFGGTGMVSSGHRSSLWGSWFIRWQVWIIILLQLLATQSGSQADRANVGPWLEWAVVDINSFVHIPDRGIYSWLPRFL